MMKNSTNSRIQLFHGDITSLNCDAIVTAANEALCGGGGVDGAVHDAAGPELAHESMTLAPCPAGEARITKGYRLNSSHVIHAVGPIFQDLESDKVTLASAYRSALALAAAHNLTSIAFPCISTGAFRFPADDACDIAIETVDKWLEENDLPAVVTFCCFEADDYRRYQQRLKDLRNIANSNPGVSIQPLSKTAPIPVKPCSSFASHSSIEKAIDAANHHPHQIQAKKDSDSLRGESLNNAYWSLAEFVLSFGQEKHLHLTVENQHILWRLANTPPELAGHRTVGSDSVVLRWPGEIGDHEMDCSSMIETRMGSKFKKLFVNEFGLWLYMENSPTLTFSAAQRTDSGATILHVFENE